MYLNLVFATLITILIATFLFTLMPVQSASAAAVIHFDTPFGTDFTSFTFSDTAIIRVDDSANPIFHDNKIDTINVTVSSKDFFSNPVDSIPLTLTETAPNTGIFKNTALIFSPVRAVFAQNSVIRIAQNETNGFTNNCPNPQTVTAAVVDTVCVAVTSTTDTTGIPAFGLVETGPNTGTFFGDLRLRPPNISAPNSIAVNPNDILAINYKGEVANALISPITNAGIGDLVATACDPIHRPCDTITVTYGSVSNTATIAPGSGGGGGGGGLIRPGLVLDFIQALTVGGSPFIVTPPSFGGGIFHYTDGLTIIQNDIKKIFDISKYAQEIPDQVLVANQSVNMTFKMYENYNPNAIVHSGLYFIPQGSDMITPNSIASIVYEKGLPVKVSDPSKLLTDVSATFKTNGTFEYITFHFVSTRSYDKMSFLDRTWNDHRYSTDVNIHDEAVPVQVIHTLPVGITEYDNYSDIMTKLDNYNYQKPQIMAHIHDTNDVFGKTDEGHVCWLYNTTDHTVTLMITDKKGTPLFSDTEKLVQKNLPVKGDYKFMKLTTLQLNRWDVAQEHKIMEEENLKAMEQALKNYLGYPFDKW